MNDVSSRPLADLAKALDDEPLGRTMFGQRELFHSNLLAWFFDKLPAPADLVFKGLSRPQATDDIRSVAREEEKIDLIFRWPDAAPLAVENKVFALPDMGQLERYSTVLDRRRGPRAARLLLSASGLAPSAELPEGWSSLSYGDLADRIDEALPRGAKSYEVETMRHYATVARLIDALLIRTAIATDAEAAWMNETAMSEISSPQARQALVKLRARRLAERIQSEFPSGWANGDLSHGKPLVEWRERITHDGLDLEAGWQYQGGDLRRYVLLPDPLAGRGPEARAARADWAEQHPDLFDFGGIGTAIGSTLEKRAFRSGEWGHFDPNFIYQRARRDDLTVAGLLDVTRHLQNDPI